MVIFLFIIPLCSLREIGFLSYFSLLSVISSFFIVIVVVIKFIIEASNGNINLQGLNYVPSDYVDAFGALPLLFLAFGCHISVLPLYEDMRNRSLNKMTGSILINVVSVVGIYLILGTSSYLVFKGDTKDNILSNFASGEVLATISKFGLTIQLIISFATLHFLCRSSIDTVFFTTWPFTWFRWFLLEFLLITVMTVTALSFNEVRFYIFTLDHYSIFTYRSYCWSFSIFRFPGCFIHQN